MTDDPVLIAYAAGIIDGEGSIHAESRPHGWTPLLNVTVQMTDIVVIEWMQKHFGGKVYVINRKAKIVLPGGREPKSYRQQYMWRLMAFSAGKFLSLVLPHLITKRQQAVKGLALRALTGKRSIRPLPEVHGQMLKLARQISSLNRTGTEGE